MRKGGRKYDEIRKIEVNVGYLENSLGSCLIKAEKTIILCTVNYERKVPSFLLGKNSGWLTAEYSLLPGSTSPRTPREGTGLRINSRAHEIKRFIGRSLRAIVDLSILKEITIFIDCDVLQADGGTRTLSVTGSFFALMDAVNKMLNMRIIEKNPVLDYLGAISVGIVNGRMLLDLNYEEDFNAEVDMNVVLTGGGKIVEIQATAEKVPFSLETFSNLFQLAKKGIEEIIALEKQYFTL
ncbi:MAG: ribonuclease PH [candidate division WOR-3 bacterium]|nr:ribonuclease PH [candidate division WOR-3 bacterium]MCX7836556.1 ribonuclease PH [candidate division WOR-3 bacterium]MDW8113901.1 ribonuclease PH [candidate division WOR-3 bacterium]